MKRRMRTALAATALLLLCAIAAQAGEAIKWQTNIAAAKAAAKKSHKLMLVDFYAEW
jgi:hypothetical protein